MRVAVIGAGIVGVATAIWTQRAGHEVVLIDREGPAAGASAGNGGVLAAASVVPVTVPGLLAKAPRMALDPRQPLFVRWSYLPRLAPWLVRYLRHASAPQTERIARAIHGVTAGTVEEHQALARGTPAERHVVPSDYLFLYRDRALYERDAFGWRLRAEAGFVWDVMDAAALAGFDPVWTGIGCAIRLGGHGRIDDPEAYVKALAVHLEAQGGRMIRAEAEDLVREGGRVTGVRLRHGTGAETLICDAAVIACGAWSGGLTRRLGLRIPLETERGYHLELWDPSVMPRAPVMVAAGKFVATPMSGRLRLAGIVEFGGLTAPPSDAPFRLLEREIRKLIPGLTWARQTRWMGHRPAPADSIPLIGPVPGVAGAYLGFGHHHIGLTAGPRTGRLLAGLIDGQRANIDLAPYAPSRFQ
ncbi:MAG: NAD(P)/FAD-dependent oxidoreductase [Gemmobacter sp.]